MGKCRLLAACIGKAHILKGNSCSILSLCLNTAALVRERRLCIQNLVQTHTGSHSLCHSYDQVCKGDQCDQNLVHIVYKGNHFTLCKNAHRHFPASIPENSNNGKVHDNCSGRIQKCGNFSRSYLHLGVSIIYF